MNISGICGISRSSYSIMRIHCEQLCLGLSIVLSSQLRPNLFKVSTLTQLLNKWELGNYSEKAVAPHSSTLAWKIPWTEEPDGLLHGAAQSWTGLKRLSMHACMLWRKKWQPTPVFLPGESQGQRSLVCCRLWGRTESGHDWSDLAAAAAAAAGNYYLARCIGPVCPRGVTLTP